MKRMLAMLLALAMLFAMVPSLGTAAKAETTAATTETGETTQSDFGTPVLRFAVTGDVHIRKSTADWDSYARLNTFWQTVYAYVDAQTDYNKLDGVFFTGDITDSATNEQYTYFFTTAAEYLREETTLRAVLGNHDFADYSATTFESTVEKYPEYSGGVSADTHDVIGGYHFIGMSMDKYDKVVPSSYFSTDKLNWLKQELDAAVADDPTKPIFVFQHEAAYGTIVCEDSQGDPELTELLSNYPQVIDFSGHSHMPLTDSRSIWQDTFTALGTGALAYLSLSFPDHTTAYYNGSLKATDIYGGYSGDKNDSLRNGGMYYIVEIDENGVVRIQIYDMFTETPWGEPYIIDSLDPADFKYTEARAEQADKPVFAEDAAISVISNNYNKVNITFPEATSKNTVQSYRVEVYEGDTLVLTRRRLSTINFGGNGTLHAYLPDLNPSTQYTIKIFAVNSWAKESDPLILNITTSAENAAVIADVYDIEFRADGTAVNTVSGEVLLTKSEPVVSHDETLGKYIATFDGSNDAYISDDLVNRYDAMKTSFTMETYLYAGMKNSTADSCVFSNLQTHGFGLLYTPESTFKFQCKTADNSSYITTSYAGTTGEWVHFVGTYDGASVKLYINGQLVNEVAATGKVVPPTYVSQIPGSRRRCHQQIQCGR